MKLHFKWTEVAKALDEVRKATGIRQLYGEDTGPGLWLVGDEGVYLMPNTTDPKRTIVYARECDPKKLDFDTWWANKRASFGGDDGVEFLPLADIKQFAVPKPRNLTLDFQGESFTISTDSAASEQTRAP